MQSHPSSSSRSHEAPASPALGGSAPAEPTRVEQAAGQILRALVFVSGLGLLVGFFLPWLRFGEFAAVSGLSLLVSSGQAVDALAGPARGMLVLIPLCGAALVAASVFGPRLAVVVALVGGIVVLAFGFFTLARVFLETMGAGMWLVVASALVAAGAGIAGFARNRSGS